MILDAPPSPAAAWVRRLFFGRDGLRAGWGIALFLALLAVLGGLLMVPVTTLAGKARMASPLGRMVGHILVCLPLAGATWLMARIEGRPLAAFGFAGPGRARWALWGGLAGVAAQSLIVLVLAAGGWLTLSGPQFGLGPALAGLAYWMALYLGVAFFEEWIMRGYLQTTLARGLAGLARAMRLPRPEGAGFWLAALALSALFGLGHRDNPGETGLGLAGAALAGLLFCLSLWRTGSLWWAFGFHTTWNWAQTYLYGVSNSGMPAKYNLFASQVHGDPRWSGGTVGPEGSLLMLPILAVVALAFLRWPRNPRTD